MPPSMEILEERRRNRGTETDEKIRMRLANASKEMERKGEFDYVVINDDLDVAVEEVAGLIRQKQQNN